jgi:hypothetical protein
VKASTLHTALAAMLLVVVSAAAAGADCEEPSLLTAAQWREDVIATHDALRTIHPQPFAEVAEASLQTAAESLLADIPCLSDQQVFARLAQLVALLRDGHTRLAIPRADPARGLDIGHTGTPPPKIPLAFARLPLEFSVFEDGVFVTATTAEYGQWLGARLNTYDGVALAPLLEVLASIAFAENDSATRLKVADRLSYPELVSALGLTADSPDTTLELEPPGKPLTRLVVSAATPGSDWLDGFGDRPPLHLSQPDTKYHADYLPELDLHYVAINEIGDAPDGPGLVPFFAAQVALAAQRDARLVVDLRHNFGGAGDLNRGLLLALLNSEEINRYGRSYMLIGRRTFSAAQALLNDLEAYSEVLFVGEDSGSMPDHYGDSKKLQLPNSGLTLRVSALHWSSWLAGDARRHTSPLIAAPWNSELWFAGRDPALEAIAALPADLSPLEVLERGLLREDQITVYRVLDRLVNTASPVQEEFWQALLALGHELLERDEPGAARLCFLYGRYYYPAEEGFAAALEALPGA